MQPNIKIQNMKRIFVSIVSIAIITLFASCEKQCVCKTTRTTSTTIDVMENEMGKMSEKKCLEYNGTIADGEGVVRVIDCHLN